MTAYHDIKFSFSTCPTLEDFANSNAFIRGVMGPFGSGKSSVCVTEVVTRGREQRPGPDGIRRSRWGIVRNTYNELKDTTIKTVEQWFPQHYFGRYVENKRTYTIKAFEKTEIEIIYLALDRPEDVKKLLSLELTGAWVNEAREVPWSVIEALQGRIGRYPAKREGGPSWFGLWMDTNPPDSDSQWYKFFEDRSWLKDFQAMQRSGDLPANWAPEDYAQIFKQPSGRAKNAENIPNLPGERLYYTRLAAGKSPEYVKVYVDGQYGFVVDGKLVYPEYSDTIHCKEVDPIEGLPIIRSWDFGLTPACVFSQVLPDGRWLTFDEMVSSHMGIDEFSDEVLQRCTRAFRGQAEFEDVGDPAGNQPAQTDARTVFEIMHAKGIDIEPAFTQEPMLRQEAVRKPLRTLTNGEPTFILHPRCTVLRKGFLGGYHRRRLQVPGPERYSDRPDKNSYSHPHDALQYGMVGYFAPAMVGQVADEDGYAKDFGGDYEHTFGDDGRDSDTGY